MFGADGGERSFRASVGVPGAYGSDRTYQALSDYGTVELSDNLWEHFGWRKGLPQAEWARYVMTQLDNITKTGAILASNTSALDIDAIAAVTSRPQDVIGLHFFSPAHVMRLLEIVRGAKTDPSVLATAVTLAPALGKVGVVVGVCDGFCANRMLYPYLRQADCLMEEGALPQDIDRVLTSFGFAMGPCAMLDMAGQDVARFVRQRQLKTWPANMRYSRLADLLCERGRLGSKARAGWYQYRAGPRSAQPDPEVDAMIVEESRRLGITRRPILDEEILTRCLYQLVNEGARLLAEGVVERPSDIDLCYVHGMGFPAAKGGPMHWADSVGLARIHEAIVALHKQHDDNWAPAPLLGELARSGRRFADLDAATAWLEHGYAPKAVRPLGPGGADHRRLTRARSSDCRGARLIRRDVDADRAQAG